MDVLKRITKIGVYESSKKNLSHNRNSIVIYILGILLLALGYKMELLSHVSPAGIFIILGIGIIGTVISILNIQKIKRRNIDE